MPTLVHRLEDLAGGAYLGADEHAFAVVGVGFSIGGRLW